MSEQTNDSGQGGRPRLSRGLLAAGYLAILLGISLFLDFRDGGYVPEVWLPATILTAFLILTLALLAPLPAFPSRGAMVVLGLLLAYVLWMALSGTWALSVHRTWLEAVRGLFFVLVLGLALLLLVDQPGRLPGLLVLGTAAVITVMPLVRLATAGDAGALFIENRFYYPISYPNGAAALYLIPFWPLVGLAADRRPAVLWRAASLGLASMLLPLALMTQSRGALYAFVITALLLLLIAPLRLRALLYLSVPVVLTSWSFGVFNRYWVEGVDQVPGSVAAGRLLLLGAVGAAAALAFWQAERFVKLSPRGRLAGGAVLVVLLGAVILFGGDRVPSPGVVIDQARTGWAVFSESADDRPRGDESRFLTFSSSGRWDLWRVAWRDFRDEPLLGVGVGSYLYTHERLRTEERPVQEAHSLQLGALAESGIIGFALLTAFSAAAVIWPLRRRMRLHLDEEDRGRLLGVTLVLMGFVYWLIHSAVDWLWHIPGLSILALVLLALALKEGADGSGEVDEPGAEGLPARHSGGRPVLQQGPAPSTIRVAAGAVAVVTLLTAALPYVSLRFQQVAVSRLGPQPIVGQPLPEDIDSSQAARDSADSLRAARRAGLLSPYDPEPLVIRSLALRSWALSAGDDHNRRLAGLALALASQEEAIATVPADWRGHFRAALAAFELSEALNEDTGAGVSQADTDSRNGDGTAGDLPGVDVDLLALADRLLEQTPAALRQRAEDHLAQARQRNPLYERLTNLETAVSGTALEE